VHFFSVVFKFHYIAVIIY